MTNLDMPSLILLLFAALGLVSSNTTITIAMIVLLLIRVTHLNQVFPWLEKYGLTIGIIALTIGVMAPLASGRIGIDTIIQSFLNWKSLLAIAVGILVSYLGGRGVVLMGNQPTLVAGLLIGTVIGVAFFGGVPVGPLIAAGIMYLLIGKL